MSNQRLHGTRAGIGIRFVASCYDVTILFGICFLAFVPLTMIEQSTGNAPQWLKGLLLLAIAYAYFVGFWVKDGSTTGMRPWKLKVAMNETGNPLSPAIASIRFAILMLTWLTLGMTLWYISTKDTGHFLFFLAAIIPAASLVIMLLSRERTALQDIISGTGIFKVSS